MARPIRFSKYHGLGNDFLIVDLRAGDPAGVQDPGVVRALCDRQFGVGGDGVLALLPASTTGAAARMRVLNADGSEAEMCGNGLRCVAAYLAERDQLRGDLTIDTGAGALTCVLRPGPGRAVEVTVDMGRPRLGRGEVPMTGPAEERCLEVELTLPGEPTRRLTAVSMGNPHAIMFEPDPGGLRVLAERVGPVLEHHPWFPRRTNVEFVHARGPRELDLVVWERGCGITLACGTGACATVVAACLTGRCQVDDEVLVHLLGGDLTIRVAPAYQTVFMRGPAVHVFDAEADLAALTTRPA